MMPLHYYIAFFTLPDAAYFMLISAMPMIIFY